ncbi:L-seryl-tRNA(Sec) selenium transferase [Dokdonella sp.]|uniref:L-seryl-tRNA(Sec) selenium transferase n=1 Tax=Dokdonella sp. TaxID=2291710 RepID=UPI003F7FBCB1
MSAATDALEASAMPGDIPALDRLLHDDAFADLLRIYGRTELTAVLRDVLDRLRARIVAGAVPKEAASPASIAATAATALGERHRRGLRRVFNLSGTVLHPNLGRSLLPQAAVYALAEAALAPVNLEFDTATGMRGDRDRVVESLLCELTGAEAATVVNNNAAAVLLALAALANRREVIVSRGELVEIGGSFRIPDVMRTAGARLREVGTTNRTHPADYADAIGPRTAALMKVHTSNYLVTGFTASVDVAALAAIAHGRGLPLVVDLGSGSLVDLGAFGLPREPVVRDVIAAGADLVTFSGDKLLGGPQAGLVVGKQALVQRIKRHPLKRALRVGKLTLAALEPVLALYRAPERLAAQLPTLRALTRTAAAIEAQALRLAPMLAGALGARCDVAIAAMESQIGSGALPTSTLASHGFVIRMRGRGGLDRLDAALRALPRGVVGRIAGKALRLDLRCLDEADEAEFLAQFAQLRP